MPRPHTTMRKIRDVLQLSWGENLSLRQMARSLSMPHTTVALYVRRAKEAGLTWPLTNSGVKLVMIPLTSKRGKEPVFPRRLMCRRRRASSGRI